MSSLTMRSLFQLLLLQIYCVALLYSEIINLEDAESLNKRRMGWGKRADDTDTEPLNRGDVDKRRMGWGKRSNLDALNEEMDKRRMGWGKRMSLGSLDGAMYKRRMGWGKRSESSLADDLDAALEGPVKRRGWGKRTVLAELDKRRGWGKRGLEDVDKRRMGWGKRASVDTDFEKRRGWGKRSLEGSSCADIKDEVSLLISQAAQIESRWQEQCSNLEDITE